MAKKGRSEVGLFGTVTHYDERGKKIGHSEPGLFGGYTNYDANGKKVGRSDPAFFGGYTHYDNKGHKTGRSDPGFFNGYTHYDEHGKKVGSSDPGFFKSYSNNISDDSHMGMNSSKSSSSSGSQGCYVATCVYGSYDCPQVWTLRRFRDGVLSKSKSGRAFIKAYYAISPTIVKYFGNTMLFKKMWRGVLDKMVNDLNEKGVGNTPYYDR